MALVKSPQEQALENLIWNRLSAFWTQIYDVSDKDALNAMYDAFLKALDAEYVRLFQIDDNKSIQTAPVYTQRRWVRLDLNKYETLKNWFRFLTGGDPSITVGAPVASSAVSTLKDGTGLPGGSNATTCGASPTNHTKHWHINFPWHMVTDSSKTLAERQTIQLSYPIFQSLTAIWKVSSAGVGTRLAPGLDYIIGVNGKSIQILHATLPDHFEVETAFDFSDPVFDGLSPVMLAPIGFSLPGTLVLPSGFGNGMPVHALILQDPPALSVSEFDGSVSGSATNNPFYSLKRTLVPAAYGTYAGLTYTSKDRMALPSGLALNADDVILLFGLMQSDKLPTHTHIRTTRVIPTAVGISEVDLYEYAASTPSFGLIDNFAHEFRISINGNLISPSGYLFDANTGKLTFKTLQAADTTGTVRLDLEYTNEAFGTIDTLDFSGHLHNACDVFVTSVPETFTTFDDGGTFDDPLDPLGAFDSTIASNVLTFNVSVDLATLNVYVGGVLKVIDTDYTAASVGTGGATQLRLFFSAPITGKAVLITYRNPAQAIQIGGADLAQVSGSSSAGTDASSVSNRYGITQSVLNNLAANFVQLTTAFKTLYGVSDADVQRLIEAAYIASVGGNPVLTLFFDEFSEYAGLPIDAPGLPLSAANTRAIESSGTDFVDIPYMQDSVLDPSIRLYAGTDYLVSRGEMAGSDVLMRKRGPDDAVPGQWWVPLLVLDEQFLSKNFGALVGDVRTSSQAYRDALAANLTLRYQGATRGNLHRMVCAYLGSPTFQNDAKVAGYVVATQGFTVTITGTTGSSQETFDMRNDDRLPTLGDAVYPGQSMRGSTVYEKKLTGVIAHTHDSISVTDEVYLLQPGDTFRAQMTDPVYGKVAWLTLIVASVEPVTNTATQYSIVRFTRVTNYLPFGGMKIRASRDHGAPYASIEGTVTSVMPSLAKFLVLSDNTRISVPLDAPELYVAGQQVYRGDPLDPSLALIYDDISRPDWYKYDAADFQELLLGNLDPNTGIIASGYVTLQLHDGDYALAILSPLPPTLPRSTVITMVSDLDATTHLLVVGGHNGSPGQYHVQTDLAGTRTLTGSMTIRRRQNPAAVHLDLSVGAATIAVQTTAPGLVGTSLLQVSDTAAFPAAGRCRLTLLDGPLATPGTTIEVDYSGKGQYELRDVRWGSRDTVDNEVYSVHGTSVAVGCAVALVGRYADSLINPAFTALVKARAHYPGATTPPVVTAATAKPLYDLLKGTATVIETMAMAHPAPMLDAISEATPVGSTTIVFSKQVFYDSLDVNPTDSQLMFPTPKVRISVADPTSLPVTPGNIPVVWLPPNLMSVGLGSVLNLGTVTPPPGPLQEPFTYVWSVVDESSAPRPFKASGLTNPTIRVELGSPQSILFVKLVVTHPLTKTTCSSVVRLRRFNEPVISTVVTSPTTGLAMGGGDWNVPSPNASITVQADLDPAVPPAEVGPYTYSWAVVNVAAPGVAPTIVNGTTASPTFTGVAANADLQLTLTVVASSIDPSLSRTFKKVFHVRLV